MTTLDPIDMIGKINCIADELASRVDSIRITAQDITSQWDGLRKAGGAREDHAATLMILMVPSLQCLSAWCNNCVDLIRQMKDNPFRD